jgi:hypothetical protein
VPAGVPHDCWTTTEAALTEDLSEDLQDAWERLRESLAELGPQRIYASGSCIMFSRDVCYVFVRPKRKVLEVCVFLDRALSGPRVRRADPASKLKFANIIHIQHRDEVEAPITGWFRQAYDLPERLAPTSAAAKSSRRSSVRAKKPAARKR